LAACEVGLNAEKAVAPAIKISDRASSALICWAKFLAQERKKQ
jgi:hypothetical protein